MKTLLRFFLLSCSVASATLAKDASVTWSIARSKPDAKTGEEIELVITAAIAPHWIVYSSEFKADLGPQPTEFAFEPSATFQLVSGLVPVAPKRAKDKTWETEYTYFSGRAEFRQRVKLTGPKLEGAVRIKGQLCNERDGTCSLFEETLKL